MNPEELWTPATVLEAQDLSPSVRGITLRPAQPLPPFAPGAHLRVRLLIEGREDTRHYSIVGLPAALRAEGVLRIAVKRTPASHGGSRAMAALQPGDTLPVAGPYNHFAPPLSAPQVLLVAGGIGITPIVGLALALQQRGTPVHCAYAARSDEELVFADTLRAALGERLATYVSARGQRLDLDAAFATLPERGVAMVCGPAPLLQAAQQAWARSGRAPAQLRFETFGTGGHRPAEAFWVQLPRHGLHFEVPAGRSLLDALAEQGVDVLADCRRGECGLCMVDVLDLQGEIDHRDVFFSSAEKQEAKRLCACVSRVCGGGVVLDSAYRPDTLQPAA